MKQDRASYTAAKVAINVLGIAADPQMKDKLPPGLGDAVAEILIAAGAYPAILVEAVRRGRLNSLIQGATKFSRLLFGQRLSDTYHTLGYRKIFVENQVRAGLAAGTTQVLVLGAGYDSLCWRLAPEFPEIAFFEVDHPATGRAKARALKQLGQAENFALLRADLSQQSLRELLEQAAHWQSDRVSVIVAEGLLMYLSAGAIRKLLQACAAQSAPGSRFVFDHLFQRKGRPDIGALTDLTLWGLKALGEPFLWSIQPEDLDDFVRGTAWQNRRDLVDEPRSWGLEAFACLLHCAQPDSA